MSEFLQRPHGGPGIQAIVYDANGDKILGRGSGFNWQDNFEYYPVPEWGVTGINEYVAGKMTGSGNMNTFCIASINDALPRRNNFVNAGPYMIQEVVADGFQNAGTIINQFNNVYITAHGQNMNETGLITKNITLLYSERLPGEDVQGVSYPEGDDS